MATQAQVQSVVHAVESGAIATASYNQLVIYSAWLAVTPGANRMMSEANFEQVSKIVHLHLSRSVIEAFEKRSKVQAFGTVVFAVMAIVATLMPYFIAPNPSSATSQTPIASALPPCTSTAQTTAQSSVATQPESPSSGQPKKKTK